MDSGVQGHPSNDVDRRGLDVNIRSGPQMREYEQIADRVAAERVGPVLDWGCGFGQVTALLDARNVAVVSYDYRADQPLREIELERYPGFFAQVSDEPVALPYPDDHFACVLSCGVLEHVQDPEASLDEIHRVLRPGGRLFVYKLPNRLSYLEAIARRTGLYYHGSLPFDRLYDLGTARGILGAHGFRVDELRLANMLPLTLSHPLATRLAGRIWAANTSLARVPLLNRLATNVEAVATSV